MRETTASARLNPTSATSPRQHMSSSASASTASRPSGIGRASFVFWTQLCLSTALSLGIIMTPQPLAAQQAPAPATTTGAQQDQPQVVSTGAGTFWNSVGYLIVAILAGGSIYSVCRSSHRT